MFLKQGGLVPGNKLRVAALISGGGTTMQRVIEACKSGELSHVEIACVIASTREARGVIKALAHGIPALDVLICDPKKYASREVFGNALLWEFETRGVDFIAQLGWLPITPENVIEAFPNMMTNQHPGPLRPDHRDFGGQGMYGRRVHAARINFVRATGRNYWTEVVCHRVTKEIDRGSVIKMSRVEIMPDDDTTALQTRALPIEHEVQIKALADISQNRASVQVFNDDLVRPGEDSILQQAKEAAIRDWPHG